MSPTATPRIVWERRDGQLVEFTLEGDVLIVGRDDEAAIRIDEPLVSRQHARIERRGGGWVVVDLGSTNHTRVNGEVVRESELRHGDEVHFARAKCVYLVAAQGAASG